MPSDETPAPEISRTAKTFDWSQIDTVLLDMDGTLIDLHFDNVLWNSHLPEVYAQANQISIQNARDHLFTHMRDNARTVNFYCIDYWSQYTNLDIMQLHRDLGELVRYRRGTERFLQWLKPRTTRTLMATNAHRLALDFKANRLDMLEYFDGVISSHDYQHVKESQEFWQTLVKEQGVDPKRALFIDDNESVLEAAANFGIAHVLCIASPDSTRDPRTDSAYPSLHHLDELIASQQP